MQVIKRDGRQVEFDRQKIVNALTKAYAAIHQIEDKDIKEINEITKAVDKKAMQASQKHEVQIEDIQDWIEAELMKTSPAVAKAYILYREDRNRRRRKKDALTRQIGEKLSASNVQNQNANIDEYSFGGRKGEASGVYNKNYALDYIVSDMARNNHLNNEIYIHDLDSYAVGMHNCLSIPFDDLLAKGFDTRQTDVRPAGSINTAFQLVAVIFQLQSLQQFGRLNAAC